jgi:peptidase M1-like protein
VQKAVKRTTGRRRVSRLLLFAFCLLVLPSLACQTLTRLVSGEPTLTALPATESPTTSAPVATSTPRPTARPTDYPTTTPTAQPTLPAAFDDLTQFEAAMRPEYVGDVDLFLSATRYNIEVTVSFNNDGSAMLTGRERIRYTNQQATALDDIVLMLWPNSGSQYLSRMTLGHVTIEGSDVQPEMGPDGLAAHLRLPAPLTPDESVDLSTEFEIQAFPGVEDSGEARFGLTRGILLAPTFYPLIPRIVDGEWQTIPAPPGGDTTNSDTALYVWRVTAPSKFAIVATGTVVASEQSGDTQTQTLVTGPMRDLALVVGPLDVKQREVDGVRLNAYTLQEHAQFADDMLDYAEGQMKTLQSEVGPYPFNELDIVDAPGAFGGIEYPGTIFIGVVGGVGGGPFFEVATVHEVGHQWFYSLIGDDQLLEPWLDEAAASYTEVLYDERVYGAAAATSALDDFWNSLGSADDPSLPIGLPVGKYPSENDYVAIVYGKGPLFFAALREALGDEKFFVFLHNYYRDYRYGFVTSKDFQAVAQQTCACDLGALFDLWVYKGGTVPRP